MYQQTFSTPFHSLNTQPSVCLIHLPDIIPIGDSLKFSPPLPFPLPLSFPRSPTPPPLIKKRVNEVGRWSGSLAKDDDLVPIDRIQGNFRQCSVAITSRFCQLGSVKSAT